MSAQSEIQLVFKDSTEPATLRDVDLIKKIPVLKRALETGNPNWEIESVQPVPSINIPFPKAAGDFLFQHLRSYIPEGEGFEPVVEKDYKAAGKLSLEQLKQIVELASFTECIDFMNCINFVIARKLERLPMEQVAAFMGVQLEELEKEFDEDATWIYPGNN
ncbi:hypothetical protein GCK72_015104 [Caenorhabditis remanei]|uniref:Skp1-related protein n=1 Tax=Caenorhabditis remanei TaxID=31234 RepID=A0A6A5GVU8_CAERE|nr:hypothetical protein GCK72_015104 [Caenorhabditis remanei]KAF1758645.1 hypothetical protein GCK72_015104 [Caenorhabditis remanei]